MATSAFEELVEDFEFLDDWEDRYALVIELGKDMPPLDEAFKVPATKVEGVCQPSLVARISYRWDLFL